MSDRRLVERCVLPAVLRVVATGLHKAMEPTGADLAPALELLDKAIGEPLIDSPAGRRVKLARRARRLTQVATGPLVDQPLVVQYLAAARWIQGLAERGAIEVGSASPFAEAWDQLAAVMGLIEDKLDEVESEAVALAGRIEAAVQADGYFL